MEAQTFHFPPSFQITAISEQATETIFLKNSTLILQTIFISGYP